MLLSKYVETVVNQRTAKYYLLRGYVLPTRVGTNGKIIPDYGKPLRVEAKDSLHIIKQNGEVISSSTQLVSFLTNNSWEEKTFTFTTPSSCAYVGVGFTIVKNGTYWVNSPILYKSDGLVSNNVVLRTASSGNVINIYIQVEIL